MFVHLKCLVAPPAIEPLFWTPLLLLRCRALFNDFLAIAIAAHNISDTNASPKFRAVTWFHSCCGGVS